MKKFICLFLVLCLAFSLCACGGVTVNNGGDAESNYVSEQAPQTEGGKLTAENVVGTGWQCTYYTDSGDKVYTRFILDFDAEYKQIFAINGLFDHSENGTYEVKGGKLYLYLDGDTANATVYEYKNGNIVSVGNEFTPYFE